MSGKGGGGRGYELDLMYSTLSKVTRMGPCSERWDGRSCRRETLIVRLEGPGRTLLSYMYNTNTIENDLFVHFLPTPPPCC